MNTKVARCTWVLVVLVGHLGSSAVITPSSDALAAGLRVARTSDATDLHVYVYQPGARRLTLITVGQDDAVDVDTNSTTPLSPTAAFMWLSPQLERHLNPGDVAHLLASLRQNDASIPSESPSTCSPVACLTFLLNTLNRAVPNNRLAMNALLDVLSDTLGKNPLEKVPEMVRWSGLLVGPGAGVPVSVLSTSTLLTAFTEVDTSQASARTFWAMVVGCPAIQEHQLGAKARSEALNRCLGRDGTPTPTTSAPSAHRNEFQLIRYLLAMLSAIFPS